MSEAEKIDKRDRRKRAEARLARSRLAREAAAAAHAGRMRAAVREPSNAPVVSDQPSALSRLEEKVLGAANEILVANGVEGRRIAELIRGFIDARIAR